MKYLKYMVITLLPLLLSGGCADDSAENPAFGDSDLPHIYISWQTNMAYKIGETINLSPIVSPSDGASYSWTIDGNAISSEKDLSYELTGFLDGVELKFTATRNGVSSFRTATLYTTKNFVPKDYAKKSIGFLTVNGTDDDIDWDNLTHLVLSSALVEEDGSLDLSLAQRYDIPVLRALAHNFGVYLMLDVTGKINYLNAVPMYDSLSFYNAAVTKTDLLVDNIYNTVTEYGFDGLNIYMDKAVDAKYKDPDALKAFYEKIAQKVKAGKNIVDGAEYDYIMSLNVLGGWTRTSLKDIIHIPEYDWINVMAMSEENLSPVSPSSLSFVSQELNIWLTGRGGYENFTAIDSPGRVVLVAPAFGLRYFGRPRDYTWANLWQYTEYIGYRALNLEYPDVPQKNEILILENTNPSREVNRIFYDGLDDIGSKADSVIVKGLGGMALWSLENDVKGSSASLLRKMNRSLGN